MCLYINNTHTLHTIFPELNPYYSREREVGSTSLCYVGYEFTQPAPYPSVLFSRSSVIIWSSSYLSFHVSPHISLHTPHARLNSHSPIHVLPFTSLPIYLKDSHFTYHTTRWILLIPYPLSSHRNTRDITHYTYELDFNILSLSMFVISLYK